jgi:glycerol-3-phosphate dehydrogenase
MKLVFPAVNRVHYELAIIGGGINGCGIARDAAGRGAAVILFEQGDLASGTSSASTKLVHGGLRYLEFYDFRLVREALREREVLWRLAPHIIWPLRFRLPLQSGMRPAWLIRLGLFLYDNIGGRSLLPGTRKIDLTRDRAPGPLKSGLTRAFEYSDGWADDSRLVVLNARDAAERGATIRTRTRVLDTVRADGRWEITVQAEDGARQRVTADVLVDASGPWIGSVTRKDAPSRVRLVKGSHIVVRRLYDGDEAYILQNSDRRIVFAIPYERDFTLIGTTDLDFEGDPARAQASAEEVSYLCDSLNEYLREPISPADVIWSYSGVRSLYDDGAASAREATREYVLDLSAAPGQAALLSVFGGKITTYRRLAEAVLEKLCDHLPAAKRPAWTGSAPLPGGDFPATGYEALVRALEQQHAWLPSPLARRLARFYGTRATRILKGAGSVADLGKVFGADLTEREVAYLIDQEWARSADDILWRRSKLGLRFTPDEAAALEAFLRLEQPTSVPA